MASWPVETSPTSPVDPKHLYRELDRLFEGLDGTSSPLALLAAFLHALAAKRASLFPYLFALVYVERGHHFRLERRIGPTPDGVTGSLDPKFPAVEALLSEGALLFQPDPERPTLAWSPAPSGAHFAGILVGEPPRRHLVYLFLPGPLDSAQAGFVLSTLRSALDSRLTERFLRGAVREAARIQQSLLPREAPAFDGFDLAVESFPAEEVGGDLHDFFEFDRDLLGLAIGDASGHGLPAALMVRDVVTGLRMGLEKELKIGQVFSKLNRVVHRSNLSSRFISLFYGELEGNGNLLYVNAGHQPPLLFDGRGVHPLTIGGTVLGPLVGTTFRRGYAHVDRGATLVLCTDGLVERANRNGEEFGIERIVRVVEAARGAPAAEVLGRLVGEAREFGHDLPWEDDATVLVVRRL